MVFINVFSVYKNNENESETFLFFSHNKNGFSGLFILGLTDPMYSTDFDMRVKW